MMGATAGTKKGSDPFEETLVPSLKVGALTGTTGFLVGGVAGILKAQTPFLYASASAIQTGLLGTTFWAFRSTILSAWSSREITRHDLTIASTISGSLSGSIIGGVTRGRGNVIPAAVMFGLFGSLGQAGVNWYHNAPRKAGSQGGEGGLLKRMASKPWSPVTVMSNDEYAEMLKEKVLKLDVEIAILNDKIAEQKKIAPDQPQDKVGDVDSNYGQ